MKIIRTINELREFCKQQKSVALVPTMGNLHEGHLKLIDEAKRQADAVIVSVFVNSLQFGQGEDYATYPRTLEADAEKLTRKGVDVLFAPDEKELYPNISQDYQVEPPNIQNELCGAFRPGHFRGVATIVAKLFNIVQPNVACFGKKDFQQLHVIRRMVEDLNFPIKIVPVDTGRAQSGLALSSRNSFLTEAEYKKAPLLHQLLEKIKEAIESGEQNYAQLEQMATKTLTDNDWQVDYVEIRNAKTLSVARVGDKNLVVLAAARIGTPRLIDNIEINLA